MYLTYDDIKALKVGDTFCEEVHGFRLKCTVKEEPVESTITVDGREYNQLKWVGHSRKTDINFTITEGNEHYGPRLTR